ncbi:TonB-dependent receptor plug domain-containing protein [Marinicella sediminis]|uniref:TonB-dependent receptor plug domain-containing protein n=1 Tax=Marinicella sediminis TaxID=1792834 RepID=A0ABV7JG54_9GAMM|nr:TonB-dependent receptor [Marinicella sediminis]
MKNDNEKNWKPNPLSKAVALALAVTSVNVQAQEGSDDDEDVVDSGKIVVTGTRIRRDEMNDTVPLEVIVADDAIDRGLTTVGQLLQESTLASGSAQINSAISTAFVTNGGQGAETLSLRGLGANRTLVLLNGRRAGPAGTRGGVSSFDFNTIPLSGVERVEILKDGASSLYGSDAVAGVVNIITKEGDGGTIEGFTSQPADSGGERSRISATWGKTYSKGSVRITADYDKQSELARGDRDFYACGERYYFEADSNNRNTLIDPRTGQPHCNDLPWGHVWLYDYGGGNFTGNLAQFDYDNDLGQYIDPIGPAVDPADISAPPGWFLVNGGSPVLNADHPFEDLQSFVPESSRATILATGNYEFSDRVEGYAEVLVNRRKTTTNGYRQFWTYIYNENFNFVDGVTPGGGSSLSAGWTGAQWLSPTAITDHNGSQIDVDYTRFVAGLKGTFGEADRWYWDVSLQHSESDGDYAVDIIYNDAIQDQWFAYGSCAGQTTSVNGVPCQDVPWLDPQFLAGNISQADREYLFGVDVGNTQFEQTTIEGVITGDLFEVPGGWSAGAFGFQYQKDSILDTPGPQTLAANSWGLSSAGITKGAIESYAVFGEIDMPLLADLPAVEELNLTLSARYTDVPDAGSDTTYKAGLAWKIGGGFTVRGSFGTSFRAPALFELFLADQTAFPGQRAVDPCIRIEDNLEDGNISQLQYDNCIADGFATDYAGGAISATSITGGGFGILESETSESNVWGVVWRPENIDLSISFDYFDYKIEDEVTQLGAATIVRGCYNSTAFPVDPLCAQFDRDPLDGRITNIRDSFINIATQDNSGYDLRIDYSREVPWGTLNISTEHTYQKESSRVLLEGSPAVDFNGTVGEPKHTGNLLVKFDRNDWYVSWFTRFVGRGDNSTLAGVSEELTFNGIPSRRIVRAPGIAYHTLSYGYRHAESGWSGVIGVRNLTDKEPPRLSRGGGTRAGNSAFYSQYDSYGRTYFVNLKYDF